MSDCDPGCERLRAAFFVLGVLRMGARDQRQAIRGSGSQTAVEAGPSNRGNDVLAKEPFLMKGNSPLFISLGLTRAVLNRYPNSE